MLLIEKVVKLLDDFHYDLFREYVKNISIRSYYPLALIDVLDRDPWAEQESEKLYRLTYGGDEVIDEKAMKKFFQLAHYTFKLTSFLANNYPDYLQHNLSRIQHLINRGKLEKATALADILLDICEKVEDHDTELKVLNFLIQREILLESAHKTQKYHDRTEQLLQYKKDLNGVFAHLHTHFQAKGKPKEDMDIGPHLEFFRAFLPSECFALRTISRFCACYALYYVKHQQFYTEENFAELEAVEKELELNDYVLFPYLFTIRHRIALLKLNFRLRELDTGKVLDEANQIIEDSENVLFWNSFINLPEIFSIAVQTSHYINNHWTSYRDDHAEVMTEEVRTEIERLKQICRAMLENPLMEEQFTLRYINLSYMYAGLQMLSSPKEQEESTQRLNALLLSYQQVPFHTVIDPIYTILVMAYFSLRQYGQVSECYNRYKKATRGKAVNPENDLTINGFYYLARWLESGRDQYVKKLSKVLQQTGKPNLSSTRRLLLRATEYFKMPIILLKIDEK